MGMTAVEKILARGSGRAKVRPGELVWVDVDVAVLNDLGGPRMIEPEMRKLGAGIWNPGRVVVVADHLAPAVDISSAEAVRVTREFSRAYGVGKFYDGAGIAHSLMIESGEVLPGTLHIGGDSHTCTVGAFGAFAAGCGTTDMLGVLVTGKTWLRVPETVRVEWQGSLPAGVTAKDMALKVVGDLGPGGAAYQAVQWEGPTVKALSVEERTVLTNMVAEVGAKTGFIEPDEAVFAYLRERGQTQYEPVYGDADASYAGRLRYDASALEPLVARPHTVDNVAPVSSVAGTRVDQVYIGSCTGGKYEDLVMAARLLRGRKVADGVRCMISPATPGVLRRAAATGVLGELIDAGAVILASGCQACAGLGTGVLAFGERCISTTNRNFRGRMGSSEAEVYLASPYSAAASAIAGEITDPRAFL